MRKIFLLTVFLCMTASVFAQVTARQFQLKNSSDGESVLYVYLADNPTGRAVVDCPGGGYSHLAMDKEGTDWAEYFNRQGISYFVLKYRMPKGNHDIPLSDAYNAVRTLRDSAVQWHINPNDVGIMGFSAGGHLASAVSTHADFASRPNFSILFYPVISMSSGRTHQGSVYGFMGDSRNDKEEVKKWSSDEAVRPHLTPRAIVILANDDHVVPALTNGVAYYRSMRERGNECSLIIYPHGGHGFGFRKNYAFHDIMLSELTAWLNSFKAPAADAKRVACIGNSITDGMGIDMADEKGYPAVLQKKLGAGYNVKNFGVSARCLLNNSDLPYQKELAWADAKAFNPDIAVIMLGTNDSKPHNWKNKSEFVKDYTDMISQLKKLPAKPKIYVCTPIASNNDAWGISDKVITEEIIPLIEKVAKKNGATLIDAHTLFKMEKNMVQKDGVHPTEKGASRLADIIYNSLK